MYFFSGDIAHELEVPRIKMHSSGQFKVMYLPGRSTYIHLNKRLNEEAKIGPCHESIILYRNKNFRLVAGFDRDENTKDKAFVAFDGYISRFYDKRIVKYEKIDEGEQPCPFNDKLVNFPNYRIEGTSFISDKCYCQHCGVLLIRKSHPLYERYAGAIDYEPYHLKHGTAKVCKHMIKMSDFSDRIVEIPDRFKGFFLADGENIMFNRNNLEILKYEFKDGKLTIKSIAQDSPASKFIVED